MTRLYATAALCLLVISSVAAASAAEQNAAGNTPVYEPAPVPNRDLFAPQQRANEDPQLRPDVFVPGGTQYRGDGFSAGSTAQGYQERHMLPAASVNLKVPLQ